MRGAYYDQFDENTILTAEHRQALERENDGAIARINDFYLPLIKQSSLRILDAGCGNGISVDLLTAAGHDAYGIDSSALRRWQWRERVHRDRLAVADGAKLPFADAHFHVLLCSGVLEHIGVEEIGGDRLSRQAASESRCRAARVPRRSAARPRAGRHALPRLPERRLPDRLLAQHPRRLRAVPLDPRRLPADVRRSRATRSRSRSAHRRDRDQSQRPPAIPPGPPALVRPRLRVADAVAVFRDGSRPAACAIARSIRSW